MTVAIIAKHEILAIIGGLFILEAVSVIIQVISFNLLVKEFLDGSVLYHFEQKVGRINNLFTGLDNCNNPG